MTDLQKVATLVAKRRQSNKQIINKIASLLAQGRAQSMVKQAGMQKTALIGVGQLSKILSRMSKNDLAKHVFKNPTSKAYKELFRIRNNWRSKTFNPASYLSTAKGDDSLIQRLAKNQVLDNYMKGLGKRVHAADIRRIASKFNPGDVVNFNFGEVPSFFKLLDSNAKKFSTVKQLLSGATGSLKSIGDNISADAAKTKNFLAELFKSMGAKAKSVNKAFNDILYSDIKL